MWPFVFELLQIYLPPFLITLGVPFYTVTVKVREQLKNKTSVMKIG